MIVNLSPEELYFLRKLMSDDKATLELAAKNMNVAKSSHVKAEQFHKRSAHILRNMKYKLDRVWVNDND